MSRQDPLRSYLERRRARLALEAARLLAGLAAGASAGRVGCTASPVILALLYAATLPPAARRKSLVGERLAFLAGVPSMLAAWLLGAVVLP